MSDAPDLGRIRPPDQPPADQPDPRTVAEAQELKRKALTPTERADEAHRSHIAALHQRIDYHRGESEQLKTDLVQARADLAASQQREKDLAVRCKQLETASGIGAWFNLLGIALTVGGPGLLGYGGSEPGLNDSQRGWYCACGGGTTACGILVLLVAFFATWWYRPK